MADCQCDGNRIWHLKRAVDQATTHVQHSAPVSREHSLRGSVRSTLSTLVALFLVSADRSTGEEKDELMSIASHRL